MKAYKGLVRDSQNIEESGNSSSMSGNKKPDIEESYSDSFDESLSNSNSKRSNIWNTDKLKSVSDDIKKGAIEDSLKSLTSNMSGSHSKDKSQKSSSVIEEDSEKYEDDEFDSVSKSKGEMMNFLAVKNQ